MTQAEFPEVQIAVEALQKRISLTESEIAEREALLHVWRTVIAGIQPGEDGQQKRLFLFPFCWPESPASSLR